MEPEQNTNTTPVTNPTPVVEQNRLLSPVVWAAFASQVFSILVLFGIITPSHSAELNEVIAAILQLLVLVGVLNNPRDAANF